MAANRGRFNPLRSKQTLGETTVTLEEEEDWDAQSEPVDYVGIRSQAAHAFDNLDGGAE